MAGFESSGRKAVRTKCRERLCIWRPLLLVLLLIAPAVKVIADDDSAAAGSRKGLSTECYDILHDSDRQASGIERQRCLNEYLRYVEPAEIFITASKTDATLHRTGAPAALVPRREVERSSADSIAEVLRDVPGIDISDSGQAGQKRIRIRGEEARRVLILIDGQEFTDQREVGTPVLIAPEMIERIEVVRGPSSVLHGSKAIGGVVNIITKKGGYHAVQGTGSSLYNSATEGFQHFGSLHGSIDWFDYRVAVGKGDHGNRHTPAGTVENTSFEWETISNYLGARLGQHEIGLTYDRYNSASDVYVAEEVRTHPPFVDFQIDIPTRDREKGGIFYDWKNVSDSLTRVHIDAFFQRSDRVFNTFSITEFNFGFPLVNRTGIETTSELDTLGVNAQTDWFLAEDHVTILGYQLTHDDLEQNRVRQVNTNGADNPAELIDEEAARVSHSVYVQDEWSFCPDWMLTTGARGFWFNSELDQTSRDDFSPGALSDRNGVGSVGLAYYGVENVTLWSRWSQGYLFPTLNQTATGAFAGPNFVNPNTQLDPERSNSFDAGMRFAGDHLAVDASGFVNLAEDYIDFISCTDTDTHCLTTAGRDDKVYVNFDRAKSFGAEVIVDGFIDNLNPYVSLAWIRRKLARASFSTYDSGVAPLRGRAGVRYEQPLSGEINLWGDIYFRASTDADEREAAGSAEHYAGWMTTNVAGGIDIGEKRDVKLSVEILNIFDKRYTPDTENLVAAGASAIVKLIVDI